MNESIFLMNDTKDIPKDVLSELPNSLDAQSVTEKIFSLFQIKNILTANEIIIGLYRAYNMKIKRKSVFAITQNIRKKGLIKKIGKGKFELV